jgi:hypothetical protein
MARAVGKKCRQWRAYQQIHPDACLIYERRALFSVPFLFAFLSVWKTDARFRSRLDSAGAGSHTQFWFQHRVNRCDAIESAWLSLMKSNQSSKAGAEAEAVEKAVPFLWNLKGST